MQITIPGYGNFTIPNEKVPELIQWLNENAYRLNESAGNTSFNGLELLNESRKG